MGKFNERKKRYIPKRLRNSRGRSRKRKIKERTSFPSRIKRRVSGLLKKLHFSNTFLTFYLLNYTEQDLEDHLFQFMNEPCPYCKQVIMDMESATIDHVIPVVKVKNLEDLIRLNQLDNLILCCNRCNRIKGSNKYFWNDVDD